MLIAVIFLPLYTKTAVWFLAIQLLFVYSPIILRIYHFSCACRLAEVLLPLMQPPQIRLPLPHRQGLHRYEDWLRCRNQYVYYYRQSRRLHARPEAFCHRNRSHHHLRGHPEAFCHQNRPRHRLHGRYQYLCRYPCQCQYPYLCLCQCLYPYLCLYQYPCQCRYRYRYPASQRFTSRSLRRF